MIEVSRAGSAAAGGLADPEDADDGTDDAGEVDEAGVDEAGVDEAGVDEAGAANGEADGEDGAGESDGTGAAGGEAGVEDGVEADGATGDSASGVAVVGRGLELESMATSRARSASSIACTVRVSFACFSLGSCTLRFSALDCTISSRTRSNPCSKINTRDGGRNRACVFERAGESTDTFTLPVPLCSLLSLPEMNGSSVSVKSSSLQAPRVTSTSRPAVRFLCFFFCFFSAFGSCAGR